MLRELISEVFQTYLDAKSAYNERAGSPRKMSELRIYQLLRNLIPRKLEEVVQINELQFKVEGSIGKGEITEVPWVCLFDLEITTSPSKGYFIAYLFDAPMQKIYLTLMQGWTQYEDKFGIKTGKLQMQDNGMFAQEQLRSTSGFDMGEITLGGGKKLAEKYELGVICSKAYHRDNLPIDQVLIADFRDMMSVYRELKGWVGRNIMDIEKAAEVFQNGTVAENSRSVMNRRNSQKFNALFTMPTLSPFKHEFMATYNQSVSQVDRSVSRLHGRIVEELKNFFDRKGFVVSNDRFRDLIVKEPTTGAVHLFEVKTGVSLQSLFTAVGQLFFYNAPYYNDGQTTSLYLVIPLEELPELDTFLLSLNIKVIRFHWEDDKPEFVNLT